MRQSNCIRAQKTYHPAKGGKEESETAWFGNGGKDCYRGRGKIGLGCHTAGKKAHIMANAPLPAGNSEVVPGSVRPATLWRMIVGCFVFYDVTNNMHVYVLCCCV